MWFPVLLYVGYVTVAATGTGSLLVGLLVGFVLWGVKKL